MRARLVKTHATHAAALQFVSIAGRRLEYLWIGPSPSVAPTLIFLHEGLGSLSLWRDFPEVLCERTGTGGLVYSRLGHGKSDSFGGPRSVRFMHDEALVVLPQLLDAFAIHTPILIGHSDGGSIALIYAGAGLGRPAGLILEAPHVFVEDLTVASIAQLRVRYESADWRSRLARHHGSNMDPLFRAWTDAWLSPAFRSWNIEQYLPGVRSPTLVIQGTDDEYGTARQMQTVASSVGSHCVTVMLDACGHTPHVDQRAHVEAVMSTFVRTCTAQIEATNL